MFKLTPPKPKFRVLGLSISTLDPIVENLRDRIIAAGSSINSGSLVAVDDYVKGCKSDSIWDLQLDVGGFIGNTLSGGLVKLKTVPGVRDTLENFNYVEGDYSETTGIKGDGFSKYLNTGFRLLTHGGEGSATNNGLAVYIRETGNSSTQIGSAYFIIAQGFDKITYYSDPDNNNQVNFSDLQSIGFNSFSQTALNDLKYYQNAILKDLVTSNQIISEDTEIYVTGRNRSGFTQRTNRAISFYAIKRGMNATQEGAFYNRVQTLQQALGRAVL